MQDLKDKPWRNEELLSSEEGMPRLREEGVESAARSYMADTVCDQSSARLVRSNEWKNWIFLNKLVQCGRWPQQACTTMFLLIPKNVTSERPIALMPTLIRWWEALRALEVAKWQLK